MGRITASRTQLKGDPRHNSLLAGKFINCLMLDGKKTTAQRVFYDALDEIGRRNEVADQTPIEVFETAVENVKPYIEVRSKRVGGASYQVPMQVNRARQQSLALRWLLGAVREKKGRPMHMKLADELLSAYKKEGVAYTKRENTHRMAMPTRHFAPGRSSESDHNDRDTAHDRVAVFYAARAKISVCQSPGITLLPFFTVVNPFAFVRPSNCPIRESFS